MSAPNRIQSQRQKSRDTIHVAEIMWPEHQKTPTPRRDQFKDVQMCAHKHDIYIIITYQMFTLSKKKNTPRQTFDTTISSTGVKENLKGIVVKKKPPTTK